MSDSTVMGERATNMNVITLAGKEIVLSPFCVYKFQEGCNLLAKIIEECGVQEVMEALVVSAGQSPLYQAVAMAPILPKVLMKLPAAATEFVALCIIPNEDLAKLYTKSGGIQKQVEERGKMILFQCEAPEIIHALGVFIKMLQIQELGNELRQAAGALSGLVGTPEIVETPEEELTG